MIQRNTWIKCGILALTGLGLWFLFQNFQEGKIKENLTKFYRIDKNSKIVSDETIKMGKTTDPEKVAECKKKIEEAQAKVTKADSALKASQPFIHQYESKGADWVAEQIVANVDIKTTVTSRIGDKLNAYFKTEQLKVLSQKKPERKPEYEYAKSMVDSLKVIGKKYYDIGYDSMIALMVTKANINPLDAIKFKEKMKFDVTSDLTKEIGKADNKMLRYFILGGLLIFILSFIYVEKLREPSAGRQATLFKRLQLLSSAGFSIGHGGNDAQKVMGIIAAALMANGDILDIKDMPNWVPIACYAAIGLGTLSGGWKIVKTMGTKITKVTPLEGVCAETAGATTLFLTEQMGIPVSTTHTITGSIIGVGATKRLSAVRWGVTINLLWAWILTIPVSALLAALTYWIYTMVN